jgi:uncharacterized membrane protein YvlD (DUF360 family)
MTETGSNGAYAQPVAWSPTTPRFRPLRLALSLLVGAVAVSVTGLLLAGVHVNSFEGALLAAALIGVMNALLPPVVAALRLPFTLVLGFLAVLALDAGILLLVSAIAPSDFKVDSFGSALVAALVMSAASLVLQVILGVNDDDAYSLRVIERVARRQGEQTRTDVPGLVFLEIDGLGAPVLRRAIRDGNAPVLARWLEDGTHRLVEWETDLSSQTGASQAGILLGSNDDIPAFRWVEKESGKVMACSAPADCAEIERRRATGRGLLAHGGASRGNLLSGEADEVILTVSRMDAEKRSNAGYRAFLANGFNVTRELVLFTWEVLLEYSAALRQRRRKVTPRGRRGGRYPFLRGALCVVVRDLIVFGVLSDIMRGRPAVYATFSSYDEVAHHSGLERVDTLEALRKLDQQFGRIERARRFAPRPYELVVLSDHGQTQGRTFKQRNGYGLDQLVERSLARGSVSGMDGGDEHDAAVGQALQEATGGAQAPLDHGMADTHAVVLGSGNLGLVYLMEEKRRLTSEEIEQRHPRLLSTLGEHPDIGFLLVRSAEHGPMAMNCRGIHYLVDGRVEGDDPLAPFSPHAAAHLLRTDGFEHVADVMVGSFYDPELEQGCAFEELISFHGGLGGPQTRPFLLYPDVLPPPPEPIIGAASVHEVLSGWRRLLQDAPVPEAEHEPVSATS